VSGYALTIENFGDACTGDYPSYEEARAAVQEAADVDGLTVVWQRSTCQGTRTLRAEGDLTDCDGAVWFSWVIVADGADGAQVAQ
jgi:hypothetical protein